MRGNQAPNSSELKPLEFFHLDTGKLALHKTKTLEGFQKARNQLKQKFGWFLICETVVENDFERKSTFVYG